MPAIPLIDYSPNAQGGFYIFNSLHASGLLGHAGLVPGDTCIGFDGVTPMPSPSANGEFADLSIPPPPAGFPGVNWMVAGQGSMYLRGWFEIPASFNLAADWLLGTMARGFQFNPTIPRGGRLFEVDIFYRPQGVDSNGNPNGGFQIELERSPWSPPDNVNFEQCLSAQLSGFFGGFEWVQGPTITTGRHEIVVSYDQTTRLATFWLDGAQIGVPRQPGAASFDFSAGNPGGQPYGHVAGAADGSFVANPADISGIGLGQFFVTSFGGSPLHFSKSPDAYDEIDFGPHTLSPTDVATVWGLRNSWAARTAAVLAQTPYAAYHLNEYPYTPPPAGWHVGAIGWGS